MHEGLNRVVPENQNIGSICIRQLNRRRQNMHEDGHQLLLHMHEGSQYHLLHMHQGSYEYWLNMTERSKSLLNMVEEVKDVKAQLRQGEKCGKQKMISVIIPVYNVEPYPRKCLDSVVGQTYRDLEILIVDDGSTDGSGKICDEYKKDKRVKVFHTENRELSVARNLGLDNATGDWIGFVDSDDWIEPDMYEALLGRADETGADIVECGYIIEYVTKQKKCSVTQKIVPSAESVGALINGKIQTRVWNKIYRGKLFSGTRFPDGQCFEDIATTHKLVHNSIVTGCSGFYYHYTQRDSSISQNHDSQNLIDYWLAYKQRYGETKDIVNDETKQVLLKQCASAISRTWVW